MIYVGRQKRTLPRFAFSYLEGGADDEQTLQDNRRVFAAGALFCADRCYATGFIRHAVWTEAGCAPCLSLRTGYNGMLRFGADVMLARAAREARHRLYIQSMVSTASIEEIAAENIPRHWFQPLCAGKTAVTTGLLTWARA
ncbi:alpha-hydroxy-acid oxidizing protein [Klebsiella quasipneumoniae]|uniref:alpha-hydroxy-acid oxidizing protein n=1 Tax=Klebsiella quasipneumoniae TaxID=1463165 RepID=UPI00388E7987